LPKFIGWFLCEPCSKILGDMRSQGWGKQNFIGQAGFESSYIVREAHSEHAKHALHLGGSGGMPPQENFEK